MLAHEDKVSAAMDKMITAAGLLITDDSSLWPNVFVQRLAEGESAGTKG